MSLGFPSKFTLCRDLGIGYILNMASELENEYPCDFKYLNCKLDDVSTDNLTTHLDNALQFIGMYADF